MDQSTKQSVRMIFTSNILGKPVLFWEPCCLLGEKHGVGYSTYTQYHEYVRTSTLLADVVCFEVQCLESIKFKFSHIYQKLMNRDICQLFSAKTIHTKLKVNFQGGQISPNIDYA